IDIIIASLILFLLPLLLFNHYKERIIDTVVEEKTGALIHTITTKGYLTKSMYETFNKEINQLLEEVEIRIEHKKRVYLPEYFMEEGDYVFTGNTQERLVTVYKDEILKDLYSSEIYNFSQGDYITIKLEKRDKKMEKHYGRSELFNKSFILHIEGGHIRGEE